MSKSFLRIPLQKMIPSEYSNLLACSMEKSPSLIHSSWERLVGDPSSVSNLSSNAASLCLIIVDTFKAKIQESGKPCSEFKTAAFFATKKKEVTSPKKLSTSASSKLPPRLVSDQMINIFFQEWAPLFPVVHRPTVLKIYAEYVANPQDVKDKHAIAQLNLIFGIAAVSAEVRNLVLSILTSMAIDPNAVESAKHRGI